MWEALQKAFEEPDGFTVIFYLSGGMKFNVAMSPPNFGRLNDGKQKAFIVEDIERDRKQMTIFVDAIVAYEIEY